MLLDTRFWPFLQALRTCLCDALEEAAAGPLCMCAIVPGEPPFDRVNNGKGIAWVRPIGATPLGSADGTGGGLAPCGDSMSAQMELGVARCFPVVSPPKVVSDEQNFLATQAVMSDFAAMNTAVCCAARSERALVQVDAWQTLGPEGGVMASVLTITVQED